MFKRWGKKPLFWIGGGIGVVVVVLVLLLVIPVRMPFRMQGLVQNGGKSLIVRAKRAAYVAEIFGEVGLPVKPRMPLLRYATDADLVSLQSTRLDRTRMEARFLRLLAERHHLKRWRGGRGHVYAVERRLFTRRMHRYFHDLKILRTAVKRKTRLYRKKASRRRYSSLVAARRALQHFKKTWNGDRDREVEEQKKALRKNEKKRTRLLQKISSPFAYAPVAGIVRKVMTKENFYVSKRDPLFVIDVAPRKILVESRISSFQEKFIRPGLETEVYFRMLRNRYRRVGTVVSVGRMDGKVFMRTELRLPVLRTLWINPKFHLFLWGERAPLAVYLWQFIWNHD